MKKIKLFDPRTLFAIERNREGADEVELGNSILHVVWKRIENFNNFQFKWTITGSPSQKPKGFWKGGRWGEEFSKDISLLSKEQY